jgi:hypothetical protein
MTGVEEAEVAEVALLEDDVGEWHARVEVQPAPGAPVQKSEGTLSCRMCGRWLVLDFRNETSGFVGHGVTGWDSVEGRYVSTWVDRSRRSLVVMHGQWDERRRALTFIAEMTRPDGSRLRWREVTERPESEVRIFRSLVPGLDGGEFEVTRVRYERKPGQTET